MSWGHDLAITLWYEEDFTGERYFLEHPGTRRYTEASLSALLNLADKKGMRLVGCERKCYNAVFMKKGLAEDIFPTIDPASCFGHSVARFNIAWKPDHISPAHPFWVTV